MTKVAEAPSPLPASGSASPTGCVDRARCSEDLEHRGIVIDTAIPACETEDLSCTMDGRIHRTGDGTWLEGMELPVGGGWIHVRTDGDV